MTVVTTTTTTSTTTTTTTFDVPPVATSNKVSRSNYSVGDLKSAMISAVNFVEKGGSIRQAARVFTVDRKALSRRLKDKQKLDARPGKPRIFSPTEENLFVEFLLQKAEIGLGYSPKQFRHLATKYALLRGIKGFAASKKWLVYLKSIDVISYHLFVF